MQGYIAFPDITPEIFSITLFGITFALRWYALAYIVGLLIGWRLVLRALATPRLWAAGASAMCCSINRGISLTDRSMR